MDEQREAIARIIDPVPFELLADCERTVAEHRARRMSWPQRESFQNAANDQADKALAKADAILALQSTHASAGMGERAEVIEECARVAEQFSDCGNVGWCCSPGSCSRHDMDIATAIRALNPDAPSGESGEGGGG